jgi:hypothetical protein
MRTIYSQEVIDHEKKKAEEILGEYTVIQKYGRYLFRYSDQQIQEKCRELADQHDRQASWCNEIQDQMDEHNYNLLQKKHRQIDFELKTDEWRNSPMPLYQTKLGGDQIKLDV